MFLFSHVNFLFRIHFPVLPNLTVFPSLTYGHAVHCFPHFNIPFIFLSGYGLGFGGTFALISKLRRFDCLLKAVRGGSGNTEAKYWSWLVIARQCFAWILCIAGSLGSNLTAKTGLLKVLLFVRFRSARFLGTALALRIAICIIFSG